MDAWGGGELRARSEVGSVNGHLRTRILMAGFLFTHIQA